MALKGESIGTAYVRVIADGDGIRAEVVDDLDNLDKDFDKAGKRHSKKYRKGFERDMDQSGFFRRLATKFESMADPLSRMMGRGSRNNFLNFFGSLVHNALLATGRIIDAFESVGDFFKTFGKEGERTLGDLFTTISGGVASIVALGLALAVAAVFAGGLVSALVLLSGIIVALSGTIAFALVGAVAALAPLLFPIAALAAGILAVVQTIKDASSAFPRLKNAIGGVTSEAKHLWDIFKSRALSHLPRILEVVAGVLGRMDPLFRAMGKGFNRFVLGLTRVVDGGPFQKFTDRFTRFLPSAMKRLGEVFDNVFQGIAGVLRATIPTANSFLDWLVKITDEFNKWANSKAGQQEIKDFLQRAADSAQSLWHFLTKAWDVLTSLLDAGQGTGNNIFDRMANALDKVSNWIDTHGPQVRQWFTDSEHFATTLGHAIEGIAGAIDTIDTPTTRHAANFIIDGLSLMIQYAAATTDAFEALAKGVYGSFTFLVRVILTAFGAIVEAAGQLADKFGGPWAHRLTGPSVQAYNDFATSAIKNLNDIGTAMFGLDKIPDPTLDIDTSAAIHKLDALKAYMIALSHAHVGPGISATSPGTTTGLLSGGTSTPDPPPDHHLPDQRNGRRSAPVVINVNTPTKDPAAVATETVNRLVAMGY